MSQRYCADASELVGCSNAISPQFHRHSSKRLKAHSRLLGFPINLAMWISSCFTKGGAQGLFMMGNI
eukprot:scaffold254524_cov14-Prasinocladus_malaysianus.AAC.1